MRVRPTSQLNCEHGLSATAIENAPKYLNSRGRFQFVKLSGHGLLKITVDRSKELLRREVWRIIADQDR